MSQTLPIPTQGVAHCGRVTAPRGPSVVGTYVVAKCRCPGGPTYTFDGEATRDRREGRSNPLHRVTGYRGCSVPNVLRCQGCQFHLTVRCNATREDHCEGCGKRHNRMIQRLIHSGFTGRHSGFFFATATAPGRHRLPWDKSKCTHKAGVKCSGKDHGCQVEQWAAAKWNGCAPQAWSWLMTEIRRALPGVDVQFWKCWETQERGVLHLHAILWAQGVTLEKMEYVWAECLKKVYDMGVIKFEWGGGKGQKVIRVGSEKSVADLMEQYGVDPEEAEERVQVLDKEGQRKGAGYLAKYCTKGGIRPATLNRFTGEIRYNGRGYRVWSASGNWGLRMKQIKQAQRDFIAAQAAEAEDRASGPGSAPGSEATLDPNTGFYAGSESVATDLVPAMPSKLV
jgi:hypothetical protein